MVGRLEGRQELAAAGLLLLAAGRDGSELKIMADLARLQRELIYSIDLGGIAFWEHEAAGGARNINTINGG